MTHSPSWNPDTYLSFERERTRPARDLLAAIWHERPAQVLDIGCGPGNSTRLLASRWPDAHLTGLDSSPDMLAAARASDIRADWVLADMETFVPQIAPDVIFANAALQWADDPCACAARLFNLLAPGGWLAVQVPRNYLSPSHQIVAQASADPAFEDAFAGVRGYDAGQLSAPTDWLAALGFPAHADLWVTHYQHLLAGPDPVFAWMSGTGLRPYRDRLTGAQLADFDAQVKAGFARAYPPLADGRTLFVFERLFVVARKD